MTRTVRIAFAVPGRTSSGGSGFVARLWSELEAAAPNQVQLMPVPAFGRVTWPAEGQGPDVTVFVGTRVATPPRGRAVLWPLNVAPLEQQARTGGPATPTTRLRLEALRCRLRRSVRLADAFIFSSAHARSLYLASFRHAARKSSVVVPVTLPLLPLPATQPGPRSCQRPMLLVVSHLYPYKGIVEFIEALASVRQRLPSDLQVRIAGRDVDRRYSRHVRSRLQACGLQAVVTIAQATPSELAALYREATLAVFPSLCENAGSYALFDGLAAGCPTLCSDRSSMPEVVRTAVQLVNPYDSEAFGATIVEHLESTARRTRLGERARHWAKERGTWRDAAHEVLQFALRLSEGR